jgi:hypothetical protein
MVAEREVRAAENEARREQAARSLADRLSVVSISSAHRLSCPSALAPKLGAAESRVGAWISWRDLQQLSTGGRPDSTPRKYRAN